MNKNTGRNSAIAFWVFIVIIALAIIGAVENENDTKASESLFIFSSNYNKTHPKSSTSKDTSSTNKSTGAESNIKSSSKSSGRKNDDPYNAKDYVHPDDFYYDYFDDFIDFEEAEDYWNEHN